MAHSLQSRGAPIPPMLAALIVLAMSFSGCRPDQTRDESMFGADSPYVSDTLVAAGRKHTYVEKGRVLVAETPRDTMPLLALDEESAPLGVPVLPQTWSPMPEVEFGVQGDRFRHIVASPNQRWVAWEPFSTHELVGVIPAEGGEPVVLDFYWDSGADSLVWAPGDRYLASYYTSPAGFAELRLYDAQRGIRLMPPWEDKCSPQTECAVRTARWTGPSTILVRTTAGEREGREYRVDIATLSRWIPHNERR